MRFFVLLMLIAMQIPGTAYAQAPTLAPEISKVAIIRVPEPLEIITMDRGSIAWAFGLLGALARTQFLFPGQLTLDLNATHVAKNMRPMDAKAEAP